MTVIDQATLAIMLALFIGGIAWDLAVLLVDILEAQARAEAAEERIGMLQLPEGWWQ